LTDTAKKFDFETGELLLIDKPLEWTSFDVVGKVRNTIKIKKIKVGHAGTLDPLASGLLIVCTGKLTKKVDEYLAQEKEYTGTITLGATTPSYDLETEIDKTFSLENITEEMIRETSKKFIGEIEQISPAYSALKIDGERAYEKARRGEQVNIKSRKVTVSEFEITAINLPEVKFRIVCSKGTYIRSIANDFGKELNNGAYLSVLRRTRSGNFRIEDAWDLKELIEEIKRQRI
jgi:tRNA pseudouridine55 synthase